MYACAQDVHGARQYLQRLADGLEHALRAQARPERPPHQQQAPQQHQQRCVSALLVRARPFYGFSAAEEALFVRLALVDPRDVRTAAALLASGCVLNRVFVPHEAHVPYELQAMMDLNIAGMGLVTCGRVTFRGPLPQAACAHTRVRAAAQHDHADADATLAFVQAVDAGAEGAQLGSQQVRSPSSAPQTGRIDSTIHLVARHRWPCGLPLLSCLPTGWMAASGCG